MRGSIVKRGTKTYALVIDLGADKSGKRRQKWHSFRGTKADAQKELTRLLNALNGGEYIEPHKLTIGDWLEDWLTQVEGDVAGKTFERYGEIVRKHLAPNLGHIPLVKLTDLDIEAFYKTALKSGRLDGKGGLSRRTVLHFHRVLSEALNRAVKKRLIPKNPATLADKPQVEHQEMRALTEEETASLLRVAQGSRMYTPALILFTTGLRRGELLGLRWKDIDFEARTLNVNQVVQLVSREATFKQPKTKRSRRTLSLSQVSLDALKAHQTEQKKLRLQIGKYYSNLDLVFCETDGAIWNPDLFTAAFRRLVTKADIGHVRTHDTRHTHASQLLRAGVNAKVVSERLGHSTVAFTLDVYGHLLPDMNETAAAAVDEKLGVLLNF